MLPFKREQFRVRPSQRQPLKACPTKIDQFYADETEYRARLDGIRDELSNAQEILYAHHHYSVLVILQGMDTSGKDGLIKHVFSGINPQGCIVTSFKKPTPLELDHGFLWRTNKELPPRGYIGIFNRSYYEDVLVPRVHPEILKSSKLPPECVKAKSFWKDRLTDVRNHETYLTRQGTVILKFYLHISPKEQKRRLLSRIDDPGKRWKFDLSDIRDRGKWSKYEAAYNEALRATTTSHAPWYVVPADDKKNARLIVAETLRRTLADLKLRPPPVSKVMGRELAKVRRTLGRN